MFFGAVLARKLLLHGNSRAALHFVTMARLETFALHLRNLLGFLYPDKYRPQRDDVLAHHFFHGPSQWANWLRVRPRLSRALIRGKERADKEIAHLTAKRIAGIRAWKAWNIVPLGEEIRNCLNVFVAVADPNRLGIQVKMAIPTSTL